MSIEMYHNPKCSKSRATLELLARQGVEPDIRLYLDHPPTENELAEIVRKLDIEPKKLIRFKEAMAVELQISPEDIRHDSEWLTFMANHPILIERPIVITAEQAAIGRPPEHVLEILS